MRVNKKSFCKEAPKCTIKEAIPTFNSLLLNTIAEIDENNLKYSTNVATKWQRLSQIINEAYKNVLSQNLQYGDISSDITKILSNEDIEQIEATHKSVLERKCLTNSFDRIDEENEYSLSVEEENKKTSSEDAGVDKEESLQQVDLKNQLIFEGLNKENLSREHLELLENFQQLETTTNKLIQEYLTMNDKTFSFIAGQNGNSNLKKNDLLIDEVGELIQQLNESISEFTDTEDILKTMCVACFISDIGTNLAKVADSQIKMPDNNIMQDNCSNTEVKMYILHRKSSDSDTIIAESISSESLIIKTPNTEFSINVYEKKENVVKIIKETVRDFQGYMQKMKQRIDRTKRDFGVLRAMLEGTIVDCESNIMKAKSSKVKSIMSEYNFPPQIEMN